MSRPIDPERLDALADVLIDHDERIAREAAEKSAAETTKTG